jgi:hypothetical protein
MALLDPLSSPHSFRDLPYDDKWEHLKPIIADLYLDQKRPLSEIVSYMKKTYGFHAV